MALTCDDIALLHDPRVAAVPVLESGDPLVDARLPRLHPTADPLGARVRVPVAGRLALAQAALPAGLHLALAQAGVGAGR